MTFKVGGSKPLAGIMDFSIADPYFVPLLLAIVASIVAILFVLGWHYWDVDSTTVDEESSSDWLLYYPWFL